MKLCKPAIVDLGNRIGDVLPVACVGAETLLDLDAVPAAGGEAMRTSGRTADPAVRAERMRVIPMRRPGEVAEVTYAILFLASDKASYITGSEIHGDGGAIAI